jgi:hypothetical protein
VNGVAKELREQQQTKFVVCAVSNLDVDVIFDVNWKANCSLFSGKSTSSIVRVAKNRPSERRKCGILNQHT